MEGAGDDRGKGGEGGGDGDAAATRATLVEVDRFTATHDVKRLHASLPGVLDTPTAHTLFNLLEDSDEAQFTANHRYLVHIARRLSLTPLHADAAGIAAKAEHAAAVNSERRERPGRGASPGAATGGAGGGSRIAARRTSSDSTGSDKSGGAPARLSFWDPDDISVPTAYAGARPEPPFSVDDALSMIDAFSAGVPLHARYAVHVLNSVLPVFDAEPNIRRVEIPEGASLTVVGDIHGQLQDLLCIFEKNGVPSRTNMYVFNGDLVDRGASGCEVALLVFAFKLALPDSVFVNRGNHEDRQVNTVYGFRQEVREKYSDPEESDPGRGVRVFELFEEVFCRLPVCTLIRSRILVLHGGLCEERDVTLKRIDAIDRKRVVPLSEADTLDRDGKLLQDLLWSDPKDIEGREPSRRGAGVWFGFTVTDDFLARNDLRLIVRSHEMVPEGYEFHHLERVLTVFSASNYTGQAQNKGSYLVLDHKLHRKLHTFMVGSIDEVSISGARIRQALLDNAVMGMLLERIANTKAELFPMLADADADKTGLLDIDTWAAIMARAIPLGIDWKRLSRRIAPVEPGTGRIRYLDFLDRYRIHDHSAPSWGMWQQRIVARIRHAITSEFATRSAAVAGLGVDGGTGQAHYKDFVKAIASLPGAKGLTQRQIFNVLELLPTVSTGRVDFAEFCSCLSIGFPAG